MKNNIASIITVLFSMFLGAALMYIFNYINNEPIIETINTIEKSVTVNDNGISDGIDNIYDAVVVVENYRRDTLYGIGSGFIYDEEGYIMTNHHVIEDATNIQVILSNNEKIKATVIGSDEYADLAVIKIDKSYVTKVAKIGNSQETKLGDTVFTIGSPMSSAYAGTVTRGILSGKNRLVEVSVSSNSNDWIMNVMQTDAAINPGNSGGPLCNVSGEVIGINSLKIAEDQIEGIGFAIPIEDAIEFSKKIISGEGIKRAYLGISMADVNSSAYYFRKYGINLNDNITAGVVVMELLKDGPGEKYGLQKGDVIVSIGEKKVNNVAELRYYLYKHSPNENVKLKVIRGSNEIEISILLGESK